MKMIAIAGLAALFVGYPVAAQSKPGPDAARRFTLVCDKALSNAPSPGVIDVNLDLSTFYSEGGWVGLNEIDTDDGNRIVFLYWGRDMHGIPVARSGAFDRKTGHWYLYATADLSPEKPDAICKAAPPRASFKADVKFERPRLRD